jgi:condensin complex subunit 3
MNLGCKYISNMNLGEEKKPLAPLLAKLYISPASTESLICEVYEEISTAIEDKLIPDATGRNALFKIHVSLGKIVNSLTEREKSAPKSRKSSVAPSVEPDEKTILADENVDESIVEKTELVKVEEEVEEEDDDDDTGTIIADTDAKSIRDSLFDSLLSGDDDMEITG